MDWMLELRDITDSEHLVSSSENELSEEELAFVVDRIDHAISWCNYWMSDEDYITLDQFKLIQRFIDNFTYLKSKT